MCHRRWILVLSLALAATAAHAQKGADVDIVSGGIGLDAREALAAKARDHTLKLVFALASREYVSDVDVEVAGGGRKLTHHAEGPVAVRAPAGGAIHDTRDLQRQHADENRGGGRARPERGQFPVACRGGRHRRAAAPACLHATGGIALPWHNMELQ